MPATADLDIRVEDGGVTSPDAATTGPMTAIAPTEILKSIEQAELEQMAAALNTSVSRVRSMLAATREQQIRKDIESQYGPGAYVELEPVPDEIPVAPLVERLRAEQRRDPLMSLRRLASNVGMDKGDLMRALGLKRRQDGRISTTIRRDTATRIIRAAGIAPCEIPDL